MKTPIKTTVKTIYSATRLNLQRLMMLRFVIMISLTLVILLLRFNHIPLAIFPLFLSLGALGILNIFAWVHFKKSQHTHQKTLFFHLLGDLTALSFLFYFSGGYSNPFIWMYLLPITVAAVALQVAYAWMIATLSIVCYTLLMFFNRPLSHLHLHAGGDFNQHIQLDIHLLGMWFGFVVSAIIVVIFIARIGKNLRDVDQQIAKVREKALESERILALGTQAASAAHELGTPLATLSIVSQNLMEDYANQPELLSQLQILRTQTQRCKEILSSLTKEAGVARAQSTAPILLKDFLTQALTRWQDTRPATALIQHFSENQFNPRIILDRTLTQALLNVLDNAADESNEKIMFNADWNEKNLIITVRDFGKGLSAETQAQLGTPFFSSKKEAGLAQGMGLGVYLTQLTLAKYEGELSHKNHAQGGVVTSIKLPLKHLWVK